MCRGNIKFTCLHPPDGYAQDQYINGYLPIFRPAQNISALRQPEHNAAADHYNGLQMLVEEMVQNGVVIENLILPAIGAESRGEAYAAFLRHEAFQLLSDRLLAASFQVSCKKS